jgi:CelD/BcsL family acetyltransferase involved in cellulose biosynthesis
MTDAAMTSTTPGETAGMQNPPHTHAARLDIADVPRDAWEALAQNSIEPNAFFDPGFALAASGFAWGGKGSQTLVAFDGADGKINGLLPVVSAWHAYKLPLPAFVALQPYSPLTSPLLDKDHAIAAAGALIDGAAAAGGHLLVLPHLALGGPAALALKAAMTERGLVASTDNLHERAVFEVTRDAEDYLRNGMGAKRLKEMRRLRNRLADEGDIAFTLASTPETITPALDRFLDLESRGWKGQLGTGLAQSSGDASFIRAAAADMGKRGNFEVAELTLNGVPVASGLVMKQGDRAFFFKIAYDETMGRVSPGVQLTLELTKRFAEDESITLVDSTANAGHPMIDHVWRERLAVGDLMIPTRRNDPLASISASMILGRRRARDEAKRLFQIAKHFREKSK